MGMNHNNQLKAISQQEAAALERMINNAADQNQAVIVDPDTGMTCSKPASHISGNDNLNGIVRYKAHYRL
jgi:hypothetical protein